VQERDGAALIHDPSGNGVLLSAVPAANAGGHDG